MTASWGWGWIPRGIGPEKQGEERERGGTRARVRTVWGRNSTKVAALKLSEV